VLGCDSGASGKQLRACWSELILKTHPDKQDGGQGNAARFREVQEAFEVLRDASLRKAHELSLARVAQVAATFGDDIETGIDFWSAAGESGPAHHEPTERKS
jgi:DnaJ-class molecular chaperone